MVFPIELSEELGGQKRHILNPIAQGRKFERKHAEAEVQVFAQPTLADGAPRLTVGRSQDSHIDWNLLDPAQTPDLFLFQHPEKFGLHFRAHLRYLVE